MAIGDQPSPDQLNAEITNVALQWRNAAVASQQLSQKITKLGTAGLTQVTPGINYDAADAANAEQFANYLATLAGVFFGTASQPTDFNFDDAFGTLQVYGA